jgi:signal transduction histidine kinase
VHFRLKNPGIEIMIEDDGKGFDVLNHPNGNGLKNMQARAGELKGTLTINSGTQGTKILLKIPVPKIR